MLGLHVIKIIPFDPESPFITSGIRLGTPVTIRGFKSKNLVGNLIGDVLEVIKNRR